MSSRFRNCVATIDLAAIRDNYRHACSLAPESRALAVVKANAYGHGAVAVARALQGLAPAFAVAIIEEAVELREAGITEPLLLLQGVNSAAALKAAARRDLTLMVHNEEQLNLLAATTLPRPVHVWLKIDTGMHRLGLPPARIDDALAILRASSACENDIVVCTHLASADNLDSPYTKQQLDIFAACTSAYDLPQSISNSAAILAWPASHRHWNRPGFMLYGYSPLTVNHPENHALRPAMTLSSEVIAVREITAGDAVSYNNRWKADAPARIATIAIGYADGYPRCAPSGTPVLINGVEVPLAGTVTMDMITVDVTRAPGVKPGDHAQLWGPELPATRVAEAVATSAYELLTRVSARVHREYRD